jgi:hypothetical protein
MNSSDRVCIDRHECKIVEVLNVKYQCQPSYGKRRKVDPRYPILDRF